jgi:hypothetical protein
MLYLTQFKLQPKIWTLLGTSGLLFFAVLCQSPHAVNAQASQGASCDTKINVDNCNAAVQKDCGSRTPGTAAYTDCLNSTISRFKDKVGAGGSSSPATTSFFGANTGTHQCGSGESAIKTKFDFGCRGKGNPIFDVLFAIIRFLTFGVGIAVVIAIILAGIKYTSSEGNPEITMAAKTQIQNAVIALLIYLFAFALLNFLVPGGLLK